MSGPYSLMKTSMIRLSVMPACCILAMRTRAGLQKPQPWRAMGQATVSLQEPHLHAMCAPTRRTSALPICATSPSWARATNDSSVTAAARRIRQTKVCRTRELLFDGDISGLYAYYLGARILACYFAWNEGNKRAEDQHQSSDPDPID